MCVYVSMQLPPRAVYVLVLVNKVAYSSSSYDIYYSLQTNAVSILIIYMMKTLKQVNKQHSFAQTVVCQSAACSDKLRNV